MDNSLGISQYEFRSAYLTQTSANGRYEEFGPLQVENETWYLPDAAVSDSLCQSCQHIDFEDLFMNEYPIGRGPTLVLQDMIDAAQQCAFCRIALHSLQCFNSEEGPLQPLKENTPIICQITTVRKSKSLPNSSCYMVVFRKILWQRAIIGWGGFLQLMSPDGRSFEGRIVSGTVFDVSLFKTWLHICETSHGKSSVEVANAIIRESPQLRLIDVRSNHIVEAPPGTRYLALSYVWGQISQLELTSSNRLKLMTKGSLTEVHFRSRISKSVSDAMDLTALMGESYLWVDALCIVQDGEDKAAQIGNMDKIYSQAVLTIVSCAGDNAESGLPRLGQVSAPGGREQQVCYIRGQTICNVISFAGNVVNESVWNSRAWTYQERILSRRSLFVTSDQAFFECDHHVAFCEETSYENYPISAENALGFPTLLGERIETNTEIYAQATQEFSARRLTNPEDGLVAIQGIFNFLEPKFRSKFIFGLPATELDMALLWQPLELLKRRTNKSGNELFPSWSWAGWTGAVNYSIGAEPLSRVTWLDHTSLTPFSSEDYRQPECQQSNSIWVESELLVFEEQSYYEIQNPSVRFVHPVAPEHERKQLHHLGSNSQILQFHALAADFSISKRHSRLGSILNCNSDGTGQVRHRLCALIINDADGFAAGVIHIPGTIAESLVGEKQEIIALSRTRLMSDDSPIDPNWTIETELMSKNTPLLRENESSDGEMEIGPDDQTEFDTSIYDLNKPRCLYNVMMIGSQGEHVRRLGLGKIHIDAFIKAAPRSKLIKLG